MDTNGSQNNRRSKDDAWLSLTMEKKAAAVGVSARQLHSYRERGCPIDDGVEAINRWRQEHLYPRRGGPGSIQEQRPQQSRWHHKARHPFEAHLLTAVDDFDNYRRSIESAVESAQDMSDADLAKARSWLYGELQIHLRAIFRVLPRCWSFYNPDSKESEAKGRELFDQWFADLDDVIGAVDPRDVLSPEVDDDA